MRDQRPQAIAAGQHPTSPHALVSVARHYLDLHDAAMLVRENGVAYDALTRAAKNISDAAVALKQRDLAKGREWPIGSKEDF